MNSNNKRTVAESSQKGVPFKMSGKNQPMKSGTKILPQLPESKEKSQNAQSKQETSTNSQRKMNYSEARLRMLKSTSDNPRLSYGTKRTNRPKKPAYVAPKQPPKPSGKENASTELKSSLNIERKVWHNTVVRFPKGPDGTAGFQLRR